MSGARPPRWARAIVRWLLPGEYGEEMLADLAAGFERRARGRPLKLDPDHPDHQARDRQGDHSAGRSSRLRATLWYLGQVVRPDTLRLALLLRRRERRDGAVAVRGPAGWLGRAADDFGYAVRSLVRNPGHGLFAALTLALGIGATTAIFSAVESVLLNPFPYDAAERAYVLMRPYGESAFIGPTREAIDAWRTQRDVFETVQAIGTAGKTLTGRGPAEGVRVGLIRPPLQEILELQPRLGRLFAPEDVRGEGRRVVVLSNAVWRSRFGSDPDVTGRSVSLDGEPWTVIGVMPPRTPFPSGWDTDVDFWAPFPEASDRTGTVLGIAREGVSTEEVQARLDLVRERAVERGEDGDRWGGHAMSMVEQVGSSVAEPLRILMAAVALLLLVACVNVANLLLSRATLRRHETAVRTAVGATRSRLVRQVLFEALLLGAVGAALGLAVAYGSVDAVVALRPEDLAVLDEVRIDGRALAFAMGTGVFSAVLFGTFPAWQGTRPGSLDALKSGVRLDRTGGAGSRVRWLLVGGEVALSFALLVGSVMAVRALLELQRQEPGFRTERLVAVRAFLPPWKYEEVERRSATFRRFRDRIAALGGVAEVSLANGVPPEVGLWIGPPQVEGEDPWEERELIFGPYTDADYHRVLGIPILTGRAFTEEEVREGARVTILGRTAARRFFGAEDPLGRRIRYDLDEEWYTVVGVAADIGMRGPGLTEDTELQHYRPVTATSRRAAFALRLTPDADVGATLARVREALRAEEPDLLFGTTAPVDDLMRRTAAKERFTSALLSTFALLALVLAGIGLYGVVSQVVGQRTREIGIRISLGAERGDIHRLVLGGGVRATALGILAGAALAWVGVRVLSSQVFGLEGGGTADTYGLAAGLLSLVTFAACWVPARRAVRVDPVEALRDA